MGPILIDTSLQETLRSWIASWFDGGEHAVAGSILRLPRAEIAFDRFDLPQPLEGVGIVVASGAGSSNLCIGDGAATSFDRPAWAIYVMASGLADADGNAEYRCRLAADALRVLMMDPAASEPIGRAGLVQLTVGSPRVLGSSDFHVRMLSVRALFVRTNAWSPAVDALSAGPVSGMVGQQSETIWAEWLAAWFDGAPHLFQGASVGFPRVDVAIGRGMLDQPLGVPSVAIALRIDADQSPARNVEAGDVVVIEDSAHARFLVRASGPSVADARYEARRVADLLFALLSDGEATRALARREVRNIFPSKPSIVPDADFISREVRCRYRVSSRIVPTP